MYMRLSLLDRQSHLIYYESPRHVLLVEDETGGGAGIHCLRVCFEEAEGLGGLIVKV